VPDEDDLDMAIAPREKHVEQHVEALRQILHVLRHRAGYVHQAEHDRLGDRLRLVLEAAIADVDRVDEGNSPHPALERFEFRLENAAPLVIAIGEFLFKLLDRLGPRPAQRHAPRDRAAHRAADRDVRGEPETA